MEAKKPVSRRPRKTTAKERKAKEATQKDGTLTPDQAISKLADEPVKVNFQSDFPTKESWDPREWQEPNSIEEPKYDQPSPMLWFGWEPHKVIAIVALAALIGWAISTL